MNNEKSGLIQDLLEIISETYHPMGPVDESMCILNIHSDDDPHFLSFSGGQCIVNWGTHPMASTSYFGPVELFIDILRKKRDPVKCILKESIRVEGDIAFFIHLRNSFSLVDREETEAREEPARVYRGWINLSQRSLFLTFMVSGLLLLIGESLGLNREMIRISFGIVTALMAYLGFSDRLRLNEIFLYLFFPVALAADLLNLTLIRDNLFFLYNLYMMFLFTTSFFFKRTIVSRFNTINLNGKEYIDDLKNHHYSDITILWIIIFNMGIALALIPWGQTAIQIVVFNLYILLYASLSFYTFLGHKSC